MRPSLAKHSEGLLHRWPLADEVEHRLHPAVGEVSHRFDRPVRGAHQVGGPKLARQLERRRPGVDGDDLDRAQRAKHLKRDVSETADADDRRSAAGREVRGGFLGRPVGGQAGVGEGGHGGRLQIGRQLEHRSLDGPKVLREPAVRVDAWEDQTLAVHILAASTGRANTIGHDRVDDDRVAYLDGTHIAANRLDPASVLVARNVGQGHGDPLLPEPFENVEVGPAQAGPADPHDDVVRPLNAGLRNFGDLERLVIGNDLGCLHRPSPRRSAPRAGHGRAWC